MTSAQGEATRWTTSRVSKSGTNTRKKTSFRSRSRPRRRGGQPNSSESRSEAKYSLSRNKKSKNKRNAKRRPAAYKVRNGILIVKDLTNSVRLTRQSIHNAWKRELGGLIRWYVNLPEMRDHRDDALRTIEHMYISNRCSVQATKDSLLRAISQMSSGTTETPAKSPSITNWIQIQMVVDNPFLGTNAIGPDGTCVIDDISYQTIRKGKGVILETTTRKGEGPAHSAEDWTVVIIPQWAVGRAYYLNAVNQSPVDLSCEMTIDGHSAAKNAPLPAQEERTIRPASHRYFETHEWRLAPSQRIPLQHHTLANPSSGTSPPDGGISQAQQQQQHWRWGHRYNEKRPNYYSDGGQGRVNFVDFPDPSTKGWTFTGSNESSKVEFFEKKLNNGSLCRMDFYYTTGTVKTVLFHPTQQRTTQLFRKCSLADSPEMFLRILENPRTHSGMGYHRRRQGQSYLGARQSEAEDTAMDDESEAKEAEGEDNDVGNMETDLQNVTYYAKNDGYAFESAGHTNRQTAMTQLQPTPEFQAWERATRQDWACIHAKCFVSMRQYMRRRAIDEGNPPSRGVDERIPLPEMASIVNVQAAQNATLSTKFHSTGPSSTPQRKSRVRMERVKGLNDDPDWGTGPIFDLKLYYRAETTMSSQDNSYNDDNSDDSMQDEEDNTTGDFNEVSLAEKLRDEMPLEQYKDEKIDQLHRWYQDCKARDKDEADVRVREAQRGIENASNAQMVDDYLQVYWNFHLQNEWSS